MSYIRFLKRTASQAILAITLLLISCADADFDNSFYYLTKSEVTSGEVLQIKTNSTLNKNEKISLIDNQNTVIENYQYSIDNNSFVINRFINKKIDIYHNYFLKIYNDQSEFKIPLKINPSVIIQSICSTSNCSSLSGNVIENLNNKIKISTYKLKANKIIYHIITPYENFEIINKFNSPVNNDWINLKLSLVPEEVTFYIAKIDITAYDNDNNIAKTILPLKVVRPLEIKHFGKYELAEVYEPIPVTGCIPGSVGNTVQYSESESETRQNSVSITINQSWSDSFSSNTTQTISEGISVGETLSTVNTSSMSNSETQSESFSNTTSESESNNISYSTNDGESWSWSLGESSSSTEGQTQTEGDNTSVSGSTTVGVSGEGSLPFLAKASGKVEVSAGVSRGWNSSSSNSSSETNGESRGYTTSGSSQEGRTFGSIQNDSRSHSLSGAYILSSSTSNAISESSSLSSDRVWNMSESLNSGKVVTEGNSESISQTIVNSNSSTTTFSYSGYIPRGRYGVFFRQTSRYVKLSEIITYDLNGFPQHAGFIMMNSWAWAPELSIDNTCENAMISSLPIAECIIQPCGE